MSAGLVLAFVAAVAAALRLLPGLVWRYNGVDTGFHLFLRREIRRNRMRIPDRLAALTLDERLAYPWAFHWLIAWIPESWLRRVPPLTSAVVDAAQGILVTWLAMRITPMAFPGADPLLAGLAAGLLFATAPALLVMGIGPRAYEVTPRPFGELAFSVMMVAAGVHLETGSAAVALVSVLAGSTAILSSKFAAQALLFIVPTTALLSGMPQALLLLPLSVAGALALTGGRYWWVLKAQVLHLRLYRRRIQFEHSEVRNRNSWHGLGRAIAEVMRNPGNRAGRQALVRAAEQNSHLQFLIRNVLWCGTIVLTATHVFPAWSVDGGGWSRWLLAWAVAPIAPFLVTSLKRFRFLGEAERYPEYGIAAVAVLAGMGLAGLPSNISIPLAVVYGMSLIPSLGYTAVRLWWNSRRVGADALGELAGFLHARPHPSTILSLPWHPLMQLLPQLEHRHLIASDGIVWYRRYDEIFASYPWPVANLDGWRMKGADLVVIDWPRAAAEGMEYPVERLRLLFENSSYRVYDWPDPAAGTT